MRQASAERGRVLAVAERLRERRGEIEEAVLLRVMAVADLPTGVGPEYAQGLRAALSAALEHGITAVERTEEDVSPVPVTLLAQARLAAASGVPVEVVLRRYVAGQALLGDFVVQEADGVPAQELKRLLRRLAAALDGSLAAVSNAYVEERERRARSVGRRRIERIERLLAGEPVDASDLGYELECNHLGLVATGPNAEQQAVEIAGALEARSLSIPRDQGAIWAWLGSRQPLDPERVRRAVTEAFTPGHAVAIGEPAEGLAGWRLSHRQAAVAIAVAQCGEKKVVRYREVALLASAFQDELLAGSLRRLYLDPLGGERDGGKMLRQTLRAYFQAGQNVSSTAAALSVNRGTVAKRLRVTEERIGTPLASCAVALSIALRLDELQ